MQNRSEQILRQHLKPFQKQDISNGSVVLMDTKTREILAMIGAYNFLTKNHGQVNGTIAPRSPGSALKPFIYRIACIVALSHQAVYSTPSQSIITGIGLLTTISSTVGMSRYRKHWRNLWAYQQFTYASNSEITVFIHSSNKQEYQTVISEKRITDYHWYWEVPRFNL